MYVMCRNSWMWFLVFVFALPTMAFAAEATATSPMQDVLTNLMQLAALVLAGLVAWAVKLVMARFKIAISAEQEAVVRKVARDGIYFAEEWGAKQLKLGDRAVAGSDKLAQATSFMLAKVPGLDPDAAQKAIHAVLGSLQGLGASKASGTPSGE